MKADGRLTCDPNDRLGRHIKKTELVIVIPQAQQRHSYNVGLCFWQHRFWI
jgi:hypothetical protein